MFESLKPETPIARYQLIEPLNPYPRLMPTWKARHETGRVDVLRFITGYGAGNAPARDIEPIMALPPIPGFIPWGGWEWITLGQNQVLMVHRPFLPARLMDVFPVEPALLNALAVTFDTLQAHYPTLDFDLSPGNLLMDGDQPVLVDCGLAHHVINADLNNRDPFSRHIEPERRVPLSASYPSMWRIFAATASPYHTKVQRTTAQYAFAALYLYLRTRRLVFETSLFPDDFLARLQWMMQIGQAVQAYEERDELHLPMLTDEQERAIVERALSRSNPYASCAAFVEALR